MVEGSEWTAPPSEVRIHIYVFLRGARERVAVTFSMPTLRLVALARSLDDEKRHHRSGAVEVVSLVHNEYGVDLAPT